MKPGFLRAAPHVLILTWVYALTAHRAAVDFDALFDFLYYHLPCSLRLAGVTTFDPAPRVHALCDGFPPLAWAIQGGLARLSGDPNYTQLVNLVGLTVCAVAIKALLGPKLSLRWWLTAILAVPLVVIHARAGYIDLFNGSMLTIAFAAVIRAAYRGLEPVSALALIAGVLAASLTKALSWPLGIMMVGAYGLALVGHGGWRALASARPWIVALAGLLAVSAWPLRNLAQFGNPMYPLQPPFASRTLPGIPEARLDEVEGQIYHRFDAMAKPLRYAYSALELTRLKRSAPPFTWNADASCGEGRTCPHFRLGGWFVGTVLWLIGVLAFAYRRKLLPRPLVGIYGLTAVAPAFIPQGHELRYWLYVPLCGMVLAVMVFPLVQGRAGWILRGTLLALVAYVLTEVKVDSYQRQSSFAGAPAEAKQFYEARKNDPDAVHCVSSGWLFPWQIALTGPTYNEVKVQVRDQCPR